MMIYDHSNPLLTHHSNQLLTHSLKIPAKIESPRRSLRSLWGLIKMTHTCRTPPDFFCATHPPIPRQCGRAGRRKQLFLTPLALPRDELLTAGGAEQKATKQHFPTQHSTHQDQNCILIGHKSYFHIHGPWNSIYCQFWWISSKEDKTFSQIYQRSKLNAPYDYVYPIVLDVTQCMIMT